MKLSVLVPVYNEIKTIELIINQIKKADIDIDKEIILVDDYSTDGTREFLSKIDDPGIKVFYHEENKGKAAGIITALREATGDMVVIQDADLEYPPTKNYKALLEPIIEGYADVVYGSRFLGVHRVFYCWHYLANKFLTVLTNIIYDTTLTDMETGAKAFRAEVLKGMELNSQGFCIEPEITAKIFKRRYRVYEVPITYCGREYGEGKKIKPIDGFKAIVAILKYRFTD